jgi:thiol-disulfide isomerase/thioredoxin/sugar lactone lactonase YvrE
MSGLRKRVVRWGFLAAAMVALLVVWAGAARAVESPFHHRVKIAEFPEGLQWINVGHPLELKNLRGKFVLLDFWTYCCINCMHILPELKKVEKAYAGEVVVIGVHSAKFENERDSGNIRAAVGRYEIGHPVINDSEHVFWERFGVHVWPTLILIDPEGYGVWGTSGEVTFEQLDKVLRPAVAYYSHKGLLHRQPLVLDRAGPPEPPSPLRFPGKILADEAGGRLFIADSNHNRIVIARFDGEILDAIGAGNVGRLDGDYRTAQFNHPQGMALKGATLYVADTENHLLRKIDLGQKRVTTIAGVGRQAREPATPGRLSLPLHTALSSPWDLAISGDAIYVAMAGCHQIWRMPLTESGIGPYAGNGREDIVDGPLLPHAPYAEGFASFAQPSGLGSDGTWLYVADSEGSSIRAVPLRPRGAVRTVVGTALLPQDRLFTFGDRDGDRFTARFQHPLGIVCYENLLYVADTYNHKIRVVDPRDGSARTLVGSGKRGASDDPPLFDEPCGITAAAGKLFVADTNNHLIRVIDLRAGNKVSTLKLTMKTAVGSGQ